MYSKFLKFLIIFLIAGFAFADQNIEIVGGNTAGLPKIAVVSFNAEADSNISDIIASDLKVTGEFTVQNYAAESQVESNNNYIITGNVGEGTVSYKLVGIMGESSTVLLNSSYSFNPNDPRKVAHIISNDIYKKLTNVVGSFTSKIAFVIKNKNQYSIIISDYDGYNQKTVLTTHFPIISLAWSPNGKQLAYVTYELGKPVVYVQDLYVANRYILANFSGSNSSPSFLPNGNQLTVTLSKDYGSHIYLLNNQRFEKGLKIAPLIKFGTIDTEANVASNGSIVFTSDHDGGPQIFMSNLSGAQPSRLTVNLGNYNTSAKFSHDQSKIVFINRNFGVLKSYVMNLSTKTAYPVSLNTNLDMNPSFSPNDKLILFSSNGAMYIVNTTGTTQTKLIKITGNIIDQNWSNNN
jgi:TolB protein